MVSIPVDFHVANTIRWDSYNGTGIPPTTCIPPPLNKFMAPAHALNAYSKYNSWIHHTSHEGQDQASYDRQDNSTSWLDAVEYVMSLSWFLEFLDFSWSSMLPLMSTDNLETLLLRLMVVFLLAYVVGPKLYAQLTRFSHASIELCRSFYENHLKTSEYSPPTDYSGEVPKASLRLMKNPDGTISNMVFVAGIPVAHLPVKTTDFVVPSAANPFTREMAVRGAARHVPAPNTNETKYGLIFEDSNGELVGTGFVIPRQKGKTNLLVTAGHVYDAASSVRGAHSLKSIPLPKEGRTFSDVRFIEVGANLVSGLAVKTRKTPAEVHTGTAKIFLLRKTGVDALATVEDRLENRELFAFTHVSNTEGGDSGAPMLNLSRAPIAVHIAAYPEKEKNVAIALAPLLRVLYPECVGLVQESDERAERLFVYETVEDFLNTRSGRKGKRERERFLDIAGSRVAVDPTGHYTAEPFVEDDRLGLWGDEPFNEDYNPQDDFGEFMEDPVRYRREMATAKTTDPQDFRSRSRSPAKTPEPKGDQTRRSSKYTGFQKKPLVSTMDLQRLARLNGSSPPVSLRRELAYRKRYSSDFLSSEGISIHRPTVPANLPGPSSRQSAESRQSAHLSVSRPVEKSTSERGAHPQPSTDATTQTSNVLSRKQRKKSKGPAVQGTRSSNTQQQTPKL